MRALLIAFALLFAGCAEAKPPLLLKGVSTVPVVVAGAQAFDTTPGTGWAAFTPQQVGNPANYGYGFYVVGNIAEVPYQTYASDFYVTVIAAHDPTGAQYAAGLTSNLTQVCFVVDAGTPACVVAPTTNPSDGAIGHTVRVKVDASIPDGQHELRWTATPTDGIELIGQGGVDAAPIANTITARWVFSTNANGTLLTPTFWLDPAGNDGNACSQGSPCLTTDAARAKCDAAIPGTREVGGCRIELNPGSYVLGAATENFGYTAAWRWLVIEGAPGNAQGDAVLTGSGGANGLRTSRIAFRNLTVTGALKNVVSASGWLDSVAVVGQGQLSGGADSAFVGNNSGWGDVYATNSTVTQQQDGFNGFYLVANSNVTWVGEGCFGNSATVFNITCQHLAAGQAPTNYHPDVELWQIRGANTVVQNLTAINDIGGNIFLIDGTVFARNRVLVMNSNVNNQPPNSPSNPVSLSFAQEADQHMYVNSTILNAFSFDNSGGSRLFSTTGMSFINDTLDHAVPSRTNVRVCAAGACNPS